jgi:hypothetical protein
MRRHGRPLSKLHYATSAHTMRANQLRLWFASMAYVLICALRRLGLSHTQFARALVRHIRLKLLKIGALVRTSVRRIKLAMPTAFPYQAEYHAAHAALVAATPRSLPDYISQRGQSSILGH